MSLLLVAPLQGRAVVVRLVAGVAAVAAAAIVGVIVAGGAPQCGTVLVLVIGQLAAVLDGRQPRLHVLEFRSIHNILGTRRQDAVDLFLALGDAVRSLRVSRESLGQRARLLLLLGLHLLEEGNEGFRIVPRLVHVLDAQVIGLRLEAAGEREEGQRQGQAGGRAYRVADAAS